MKYETYVFTIMNFFILFFVLFFIVFAIVKSYSSKKKISQRGIYSQKRQMHAARKALESNLRQSPSAFYYLKNSCLTVNESLMFDYINTALNELIPDSNERATYYVFPQVALYSLIGLRSDLAYLPRETAATNYMAKSIDFVVCRKRFEYYAYAPILLIELDGKSHFSPAQYGVKNYYRQQDNDAFKNAVFDGLKLPLLRYRITGDHLSSKDAPYIKQMLAENLPR